MHRDYRCVLLFVSLGLKPYMSILNDSVNIHKAPNYHNNGDNQLYAYDTQKINMISERINFHCIMWLIGKKMKKNSEKLFGASI